MDDDPIQEYIPDVNFHRSEESLDGGGLIMKLDGDIDMFVSPALTKRFDEIAEQGAGKVVVDMSEARFIDSTVLEALVNAQKQLQQKDSALAVVAAGPYTRRTFNLTGLDEVLNVSESRDEAVARLG